MAPIPEALKQAIEQHHTAAREAVKGNVLPWNKTSSHQEDVTILGAWGGYERGWVEQVETRIKWAVGRFQGGEIHHENISLVVTSEMAYSVDIERCRIRLVGKGDLVPIVLRVTTIYRLEDGEWKVVHRHADPLVTVQETDSIVQKR